MINAGKVAICLSVYNGEAFLEQQLESIFKQSYIDFKLVVRDDGSVDNSLGILKSWSKKDDRLTLLQDEMGNLGCSSSFMKIVESVDADLYLFCDQDDVWIENKVELAVTHFLKFDEETPRALFTDLSVVDNNMNPLCSSYWEYQKLAPEISTNWRALLSQNVITGCTLAFNRAAKNAVLPFALKKMLHDHWVGVSVAKVGEVNYISEQTVLYRQHLNNVLGANSYSLRYILNRVKKLGYLYSFYREATVFFGGVTMFDILKYKIVTNIRRWFI